MGEKAGDRADGYRACAYYQAWVHLHALDFAGVLALCESLLPSWAIPCGHVAAILPVLGRDGGNRLGNIRAHLAIW